jgi:hypothetical protein
MFRSPKVDERAATGSARSLSGHKGWSIAVATRKIFVSGVGILAHLPSSPRPTVGADPPRTRQIESRTELKAIAQRESACRIRPTLTALPDIIFRGARDKGDGVPTCTVYHCLLHITLSGLDYAHSW